VTEALKPFVLFIAGTSFHSLAARANLVAALASTGRHRDDVTFIDVNVQPDLAATFRVFATPTLLRSNAPERRLTGDLSSSKRLQEFLK
jgi:hypothetical protein